MQVDARNMLESPEMQEALARLTALSLQATDAMNRQKNHKISSASKPELNKRVATLSPLSGLNVSAT